MRRGPSAVALCLLAVACTGTALHRGASSDHFDGERYFNPGAPFDKSWRDLLRYYRERNPGVWTRDLTLPPGPRPPERLGAGELRATFVNHATVLLQADGLNLLTDPIWSLRASPVQWAGPKRYRPPGIAFDDLPVIDVVLLSHNHYDHLDLTTLKRLRDRYDPWFVVGLGGAALLHQINSGKIVELDWNQAWTLPNGCQLWAVPSRHWSGRGFTDRNRSLWLSYVIQTGSGPVYFAGDTGTSDQFENARRRFGAMRLALLPIGAYEPRWLTDYQHLDPAQAVQAHRQLQSQFSMGIHYGTFELSDEGQHEPPLALAKALAAQGIAAENFVAAGFGAGYPIPPLKPSGARP